MLRLVFATPISRLTSTGWEMWHWSILPLPCLRSSTQPLSLYNPVLVEKCGNSPACMKNRHLTLFRFNKISACSMINFNFSIFRWWKATRQIFKKSFNWSLQYPPTTLFTLSLFNHNNHIVLQRDILETSYKSSSSQHRSRLLKLANSTTSI